MVEKLKKFYKQRIIKTSFDELQKRTSMKFANNSNPNMSNSRIVNPYENMIEKMIPKTRPSTYIYSQYIVV